MQFTCDCCNYSTLFKHNYEKHLLTKKHDSKALEKSLEKESNIKQFICEKCKKKLSSKQRLLSHATMCKGVSSTLECSKCHKFFNTPSARYKHELKCQPTQMTVHNNTQVPTINSIGNNNTIANGNNNIQIVVNNFGSERFDYFMDHPDFISFMNKCIEDKAGGICNLIAKKHFDPDHPENHNIRKLNKKDNFLEIYKDNRWNTRDYKSGLDQITIPLETTFSIFMEKMVQNNDDIKRDIFQHFMKEVGSILEWDLSTDNHDFSFNNRKMQNELDDKSKRMLKTKIYKLFCETIFNYTKMIHI